MAIIHCPDCEALISDTSPYCNNCGVRIANTLNHCKGCAKAIHRNEKVCPYCGTDTMMPVVSAESTKESNGAEEEIREQVIESFVHKTPKPSAHNKTQADAANNRQWYLAIILTVVFIGVSTLSFYLTETNKVRVEIADYEALMQTTNTDAYRHFLNTYPNSVFKKSVEKRLAAINREENYWKTVATSHNDSLLTDYLKRYPQGIHVVSCKQLIDSLQWERGLFHNNVFTLKKYIAAHSTSAYAELAKKRLSYFANAVVTDTETQAIVQNIHDFWKQLNSGVVTPTDRYLQFPLQKFMGKLNATAEDVKQYASTLRIAGSSKTFGISGAFAISKNITSDSTMYYFITVPVVQTVKYKSGQLATVAYTAYINMSPNYKIQRLGIGRSQPKSVETAE